MYPTFILNINLISLNKFCQVLFKTELMKMITELTLWEGHLQEETNL